MKAILEVEFNPADMCDEETLKKQYSGSWFKLIKFLYDEEGLGIFAEEIKLVEVKSE